MIQKDKLNYELWLVGEICGQFWRVNRGLVAIREEIAKLATGTVESVLLRLGDSRPDEWSGIVVDMHGRACDGIADGLSVRLARYWHVDPGERPPQRLPLSALAEGHQGLRLAGLRHCPHRPPPPRSSYFAPRSQQPIRRPRAAARGEAGALRD